MPPELCFRSAHAIGEAVREGTLSAERVVEAHLRRIADVDARLNAFVTVLAADARERARELDAMVRAGEDPGPLAGVPVGLKDIYGFKQGVRNTFGSLPLAEFEAPRDAVFVERLENAGAVVIGKTNVPEFGHKGTTDNELVGPTRTPFDLDRNAGGSSGGSAAAVAAGLTSLAQGGDGGGSIRIPAACCGVVGLKPSHRRIPNRERPEAFGAARPFVHYGPLARSVTDAALMVEVMAGPHPADPHVLPGEDIDYVAATGASIDGLSVAYSSDFGVFPVATSVREVIDDAVGAFGEAGATVVEVEPSIQHSHADLCRAWTEMHGEVLAKTNESFKHTQGIDLLGDHRAELTPIVAEQMARGSARQPPEQFETDVLRTAVFDAIQAVFDDHDLLVTPTLAVPPPANSNTIDGQVVGPTHVDGEPVDPYLGWCLTYLTNFTGHPTASVPAGFTAEGLPVGLQIIGPRFDDATVVAASAAFERERPWNDAYTQHGL